MNNKEDLLKLRKMLSIIALSSVLGLTGCASNQNNNHNGLVVESNEDFEDYIYVDDQGDTILVVKPRKVLTSNGEVFVIPYDYELSYDKYGKPIGRKVMKTK